MKYAIISDIHGNYPALKLVLEDALKQGAQEFLFVGDYCISTPWPREVVETIKAMDNAYVIRGNEESYLNVPDGVDAQFEISRWCKHVLSEEQKAWLSGLPVQLNLQCENINIHMVHSSEIFIGKGETGKFSTSQVALRYQERYIVLVEERRVKYDVHALIDKAKTTEQYEKVPVWSEVIFREWRTGHEKLYFFLKYVEEFAQRIGDERIPYAHDTWQAAYEEWTLL